VVGAFLALQWLILTALAPAAALGFSLVSAWVLGVFAGVTLFSSPAIGLLPIPRATLWRVQWLLSLVVATMGTTAAKLIAVGVAAPFGRALDLPFLALSGCLDFLYNSVLLAVIAATGLAAGRPRTGAPIVKRSAQALGIVVTFMGCVWGFVLRPILPTSWAHVTDATAIVMGAALVVGLATFFYRPPAHEPRPGFVRREIRRRRGHPGSVRPGRLAGISRLIADDLWSTASMAALVPAIVAAGLFGMHTFNPAARAGDAFEAVEEMGILPLRDDAAFAQCYFLLFLGFALINSRRFSGAPDPVSPIMRQLRVLPVSARQLNALIVGRRLLGWVVVWLCLLVFHVVAFRVAPTTLRPDILLWVAGADALVYALFLCWMRWLPIFTFVMIFSLVATRLIDAFGADLAPLAGSAIGLACLAAAIWINHVTLNLRQEPYRPVPEPAFTKWFAVR
jgi:hypothetical protein